MRKKIIILLLLVVVLFGLAGCGKKEEKPLFTTNKYGVITDVDVSSINKTNWMEWYYFFQPGKDETGEKDVVLITIWYVTWSNNIGVSYYISDGKVIEQVK